MLSHLQATAATKRLQEVENGQDKALKDAKAQAAKSRQEAEQMAERLKGSEAQMAELRSDHTVEAAGFAGIKRELEVTPPPPFSSLFACATLPCLDI